VRSSSKDGPRKAPRDDSARARAPLKKSFFARPVVTVAQDLIGAILVRRQGGRTLRARITETEAYLGPEDLASHASKGRTKRTEIMFGPPGRAYVYLIYGIYEMFNVVTGRKGEAQAVLIRGAEPLDGWEADLSGPGKLARAMAITRAENGVDVTQGDLTFSRGESGKRLLATGPRVGVDYAKEWKDKPYRFLDADCRLAQKLVALGSIHLIDAS
jgi:DNA-3-methyladenine glycosylase